MISASLWLDWTTNFPIVASHSLNIGKRPLKNSVLGDTTAGEFNCTKPIGQCKKNQIDSILTKVVASTHRKWLLRTQFQCFGTNLTDGWPGAYFIEVHLHSKLCGGTLKWLLKGGSRLIEVVQQQVGL